MTIIYPAWVCMQVPAVLSGASRALKRGRCSIVECAKNIDTQPLRALQQKPPAISAGGFLFQERSSARTIKEEKPKEQALSNPVLRQCHIAASSSITEGCCSTNVSRAAAVPVGFAWPCSHFVQGKEDNAINGGERWSQGLTYYKLCIISCLFEGETDAVGH